MLKFENLAEVGNKIKAYDFQPREGHREHFLEGIVVNKGKTPFGFAAYHVLVTESTIPNRVGEEMLVPFGMVFDEWDGRVSLVA